VLCIKQVFNDAIEALRISYKKMNPFCVPFATTNMGSAMLAMDLVCLKDFWTLCLDFCFHQLVFFFMSILSKALKE